MTEHLTNKVKFSGNRRIFGLQLLGSRPQFVAQTIQQRQVGMEIAGVDTMKLPMTRKSD